MIAGASRLRGGGSAPAPFVRARGAAAALALALLPGFVLAAAGAAEQRAEDGVERGHSLFSSVCVYCHSAGGRKAGKGPKLAGTARSDEFIIERIRNGKKGRMPAFDRTFDDDDIRAILAYIRSLSKP